jgi:hypothetical protein
MSVCNFQKDYYTLPPRPVNIAKPAMAWEKDDLGLRPICLRWYNLLLENAGALMNLNDCVRVGTYYER